MITWSVKKYDELSKNELYSIIQFRMSIFIVEQKSIYEDLDNLDQHAVHFLGMDDDKLIAYGRVHIDSNNQYAIIRRICIHKNYRGQKLGDVIMEKIIAHIQAIPDLHGAELDAQVHLQYFYEKFGFHPEGEPYDDGGILHVRMLKNYPIAP
ncbi:MAG: hypothetical protein A3F13_06750 [Gammaproteobacteria bacterium RIFCSPHIGHO2_12_FULL_40_19]|nr:MAG: hypothetical protein A3F13_06750 [Gammaproteobacteria bacterium RIFCSPHIGHO2_12_FULL_40_19]